jgi:hypothetical protein
MIFLQIYSSVWNVAGLQRCRLIGYPLIAALNIGVLLFSPFESVWWRGRGHGFYFFFGGGGGLLGSSLHSTEMVRLSGVSDHTALEAGNV